MSALPAPERVLPTLNADGTRRRIRPKLSRGTLWRARKIVGYSLIAAFVGLPFLRFNGKPLVLLDIAHRQFTLFGGTFLPTDGALLMLLMLAIFVGIFWLTALVGRAWCGFACPQTVYMELVFRPIERLFEGGRAQQLRLDRRGFSLRRAAKLAVFGVMSVLVGNVFLAYFVGTDTLAHWMTHSPFEHRTGFLVMGATAGLMFFDFAYFREQMCTVVCPYARLQSVLLDGRSLIIGYDRGRGEPRGKGKLRPGQGDCIDCSACVTTCPTGIDIREGLQLECIACGQCVDACNSIMHKIGKPLGLIRYGTEQGFSLEPPASLQKPFAATKPRLGRIRARTLIYPAIFAVLVVALVVIGRPDGGAELTVLRGIGAPFTEQSDGIQNQIRIKIQNRNSEPHAYSLELLDAPDAKLIAPEIPLMVPANERRETSVFVLAPRALFPGGVRNVRFRVRDGERFDKIAPYKLLGPVRNNEPERGIR